MNHIKKCLLLLLAVLLLCSCGVQDTPAPDPQPAPAESCTIGGSFTATVGVEFVKILFVDFLN